jgi:hypothetical protein
MTGWQTYVPIVDGAEAYLSATVAAHTLWVVDGSVSPGLEPGGFITSLINTMLLADRGNLTKLAVGFPYYAEAVNIYKNRRDGVAWLTAKALQ